MIFMSIVLTMITCFAGFYFLPPIEVQQIPNQLSYTMLDVDGVCDYYLMVNIVITLQFFIIKVCR